MGKFGAIIAGFVIGVLVIEGCEKKRNGNTEQHEGTRDHRGGAWQTVKKKPHDNAENTETAETAENG